MLENRPLILRGNRFLGSALVERGLITTEDLEAANEKLLELVQAADVRNANLLNILLYELKAIDEDALLESLLENDSVSFIDLNSYDLRKSNEMNVNLDACWATYSLPFDRVEDFVMIATSYYLSKPVITYWEDQFKGTNIIWYVASNQSIAAALERLQQERSAATSEEAKKE